jgi:hypothetical protein
MLSLFHWPEVTGLGLLRPPDRGVGLLLSGAELERWIGPAIVENAEGVTGVGSGAEVLVELLIGVTAVDAAVSRVIKSTAGTMALFVGAIILVSPVPNTSVGDGSSIVPPLTVIQVKQSVCVVFIPRAQKRTAAQLELVPLSPRRSTL